MQRAEKERVVEELAGRLRETESLIVADYRGLTNAELAGVRTRLRDHGATFTVVKNTLTRRAAVEAGAESLLALLEGPTAIAFVQVDGDPVAVAKALADTARDTKILSLRGGILSGKPMEAADVEELAKLPPLDVLKGQLVGVIIAPVAQLVGLLSAPLRDLVGLIDARIEQLGGDAAAASDADATAGPAGEPEPAAVEEPAVEVVASAETAAAQPDEESAETGESTETEETQTENQEEQE